MSCARRGRGTPIRRPRAPDRFGPMTRRGTISFSSRAGKPPVENPNHPNRRSQVYGFVGTWRPLFFGASNRASSSQEQFLFPTPRRHANELLQWQRRETDEKSFCTADVTNLPLSSMIGWIKSGTHK
ncbi:hypothetical protein B296_00010426 [Ensete ventricosum]|uniref:Uncharacterized protein n=1 Tax=Ensete ventricosum TaxID=4639 RepID=A0A426ZA28_ENSVE|nr:hypothetical protein B296_00010426 [Ensete ventricosum]